MFKDGKPDCGCNPRTVESHVAKVPKKGEKGIVAIVAMLTNITDFGPERLLQRRNLGVMRLPVAAFIW